VSGVGEQLTLASPKDGFAFGAYRAPHDDARRGGLVLIQEIFGVTDHIRELADGFAADGYETLAPSLYDRQQRGFEAGYEREAVARARKLSEAAPWDEVAADLAACVAALAPPVFVAGYCWGGAATWLAACRCEGVAAASSFYGRRIPELVAETPRCPIILHFGGKDPAIPPETVEAIAAAHPDIPIYKYDAGHGFVSDRRADYDPDSARLARLRTLQLFSLHGGGRGDI
jgi:carboxymethylenebutenolidase